MRIPSLLLSSVNEWLERLTGFEGSTGVKLIESILIILILWLVYRLMIFLLFRKTADELKRAYYTRKTVQYVVVAIGFLTIGNLWVENFQSVTTFLGLLSAGIAIALKDIFVNIAGWGFILLRAPFEVGDRIQIGNVAGDVIDVRLFQFSVIEIGNWVDADQSTGRVIHIPNGKVFSEPQANYSVGFNYIWNEVSLYLTLDSDWKKAKRMLFEILHDKVEKLSLPAKDKIQEATRKYMIVYKHLKPTVYTSVKDRGVQLTMRYLCDPRKRRSSEEILWETILEVFSKHPDLRYAFPTQRLYVQDESSLKKAADPNALTFPGPKKE